MLICFSETSEISTLARSFAKIFLNPAFDSPVIDNQYTGCDRLGVESCFNTPQAARQVMFMLTMVSRHTINELWTKAPKCRELLDTKDTEQRVFKGVHYGDIHTEAAIMFEQMVTRQVLKGKVVLDLGCGVAPSFARVGRKLGATVFTVDVVEAASFEGSNTKHAVHDQDFHIVCDLNRPDAAHVIQKTVRSDLNLVTEAHANTGWTWESEELAPVVATTIPNKSPQPFAFHAGRELADCLLTSGGYYYNGGENTYSCKE